jgi:hypothetical protein
MEQDEHNKMEHNAIEQNIKDKFEQGCYVNNMLSERESLSLSLRLCPLPGPCGDGVGERHTLIRPHNNLCPAESAHLPASRVLRGLGLAISAGPASLPSS